MCSRPGRIVLQVLVAISILAALCVPRDPDGPLMLLRLILQTIPTTLLLVLVLVLICPTSDSTIAVDWFWRPAPWLPTFIMATFFGGQWLVTVSVIREPDPLEIDVPNHSQAAHA